MYIVTYCYNTGGVYFYTHQIQSVLWTEWCTFPFLLQVLYQTHVSVIRVKHSIVLFDLVMESCYKENEQIKVCYSSLIVLNHTAHIGWYCGDA